MSRGTHATLSTGPPRTQRIQGAGIDCCWMYHPSSLAPWRLCVEFCRPRGKRKGAEAQSRKRGAENKSVVSFCSVPALGSLSACGAGPPAATAGGLQQPCPPSSLACLCNPQSNAMRQQAGRTCTGSTQPGPLRQPKPIVSVRVLKRHLDFELVAVAGQRQAERRVRALHLERGFGDRRVQGRGPEEHKRGALNSPLKPRLGGNARRLCGRGPARRPR